jgi:hypothetical protein
MSKLYKQELENVNHSQLHSILSMFLRVNTRNSLTNSYVIRSLDVNVVMQGKKYNTN